MDQEIEEEAARMADKVTQDMAKLIADRASSVGNATINLNASSIGNRWISTLAIVMFVMMVMNMAFNLYVSNNQNSTISEIKKDTRDSLGKMELNQNRQQDYLNIILQWSPELRKKIEEQGNKK